MSSDTVAMEASARLCLYPIIISDVLRESIIRANSAFSSGLQQSRVPPSTEVNRGRSPMDGFKESVRVSSIVTMGV